MVEQEKDLDESSAGSVLELAELVERHDGVAALNDQSHVVLRSHVPAGSGTSPDAVRHFVMREDGAVVGYAQLDLAAGSAELLVHPEHRRQGRGRALLDAVRSLDPQAAIWAHGDLAGAQGLAEAAGLRPQRTLLKLAAGLPEVMTVAGVPADTTPAAHGLPEARTFTDDDAEAVLALNADAFAAHPEQGRMGLDGLRARQGEPWFDPAEFWLVPSESGADGELDAFLWLKIEPEQNDPGSSAGEIYVLGVAPPAQGRRLGSRLTSLALARLAARGLRYAELYVEADNLAARRTYESKGFATATVDTQYA